MNVFRSPPMSSVGCRYNAGVCKLPEKPLTRHLCAVHELIRGPSPAEYLLHSIQVATQTVVAAGLAYLIYKGYERFQLKKNGDYSPGPDAPSSSVQAGVTPTGTTTTRTVTVVPADPNAPGLKAVGGL